MRFSYKPIVDKFGIPRPTLIEWKKRVKSEPGNWRVKHLSFLQNQIVVENETLKELFEKSIVYEELFVLSVCLYLGGKNYFINKIELKQLLKDFAYTKQNSVEFRHDFAKEIWNIKLDDESDRHIADYTRVFNLLDNLSSFQYYVLFMKVIDFIDFIKEKIDIGFSKGLVGKTWQELHSLQREFSKKSILIHFDKIISS
jgi:hypothetical protein